MSLRGSLVENYQNFLRKEGDGMGSFVGTYEYNLDSKNRLVVPAPFKDLIGNTFIVRAKPGKFSTSVVVVSCPPVRIPSYNTGSRLARLA